MVLVNMIMNNGVPQNAWKFLPSRATAILSKTLFHRLRGIYKVIRYTGVQLTMTVRSLDPPEGKTKIKGINTNASSKSPPRRLCRLIQRAMEGPVHARRRLGLRLATIQTHLIVRDGVIVY